MAAAAFARRAEVVAEERCRADVVAEVSALCSTDEDTLDDLADSSTEADSALLAGAVALESLLVARRGLVLGSALEESRLARATSSGEKGVASVREPSHMRIPPASRVRRGARIEWP